MREGRFPLKRTVLDCGSSNFNLSSQKPVSDSTKNKEPGCSLIAMQGLFIWGLKSPFLLLSLECKANLNERTLVTMRHHPLRNFTSSP